MFMYIHVCIIIHVLILALAFVPNVCGRGFVGVVSRLCGCGFEACVGVVSSKCGCAFRLQS